MQLCLSEMNTKSFSTLSRLLLCVFLFVVFYSNEVFPFFLFCFVSDFDTHSITAGRRRTLFFFSFVSFFSSCMLFSFCQSELTTHKTTGCDGRCVTFWRGIPNVQFGHHLRTGFTTGGAVLSQNHLKIHLNCGLFIGVLIDQAVGNSNNWISSFQGLNRLIEITILDKGESDDLLAYCRWTTV